MSEKKNINDFSLEELKALAEKLKLKAYPKSSRSKLKDFILSRKGLSKIDRTINPSWWTKNRNEVFGWASIIGLIITIITLITKGEKDNLEINSNTPSSELQKKETSTFNSISTKDDSLNSNTPSSELQKKETAAFNSIFTKGDSLNFNILILRFEDYIEGKDTYSIGRSIQEHLNTIQTFENLYLPINAKYMDEIPPPATIDEVKKIQKKHFADLIIYGLAKNIDDDWENAEICFRYIINESIIAEVTPAINFSTAQHDLNYVQTSLVDMEKGRFQIDALSLKHWITSLINMKANRSDEAFLELDKIVKDSTLNDKEKAKRYFVIGETYSDLNQYSRSIQAFDKVIVLDSKSAKAYYKRGSAYYKLKEFKRAIQDYDKAISLKPDFAIAYIGKGAAHNYLEDYKQAIQDFNNAISLNSGFAIAYFNRGVAYSKLKDYSRAIQDYNKAISLNPDYEMAYKNRGIIHAKLEELFIIK